MCAYVLTFLCLLLNWSVNQAKSCTDENLRLNEIRSMKENIAELCQMKHPKLLAMDFKHINLVPCSIT